jgi:hypothetical protein
MSVSRITGVFFSEAEADREDTHRETAKASTATVQEDFNEILMPSCLAGFSENNKLRKVVPP